MECKYLPLGDGTFKCAECGDIAQRLTKRPCDAAGPQPISPPPLYQRLKNFSRASISHALGGFPTCTQAQIAERYAICRACPLYLPDKDNPEIGACTHEDCGCSIMLLGQFVSKLAWADQKCPLDKWRSLVPE